MHKFRYEIKLLLIFFVSIICYGIFVSLFTSPVHIGVDEELYIALARSFHYKRMFIKGGEVMNYNCVLYSMIISIAYYFYSPERIMFIIRMMGVIMMCSSIFPVGCLAKKVIENEKESIFVTIVIAMMPYMFDVAYAMQEVLSYPLFCWLIYLMYYYYDNSSRRKCGILIWISVLSVLLVYTKTYLFFIPIVINIMTITDMIQRKRGSKEDVRTLVIYDTIYAVGFFSVYRLIYIINGFQKGVNHYSSQIMCLFPITIKTFLSGISCSIIYLAFFVVCTGFVPYIMIWNRQNEKKDRILCDFHKYGVLFLIIEIVFMIILTEMGTNPLPRKFLFRYFQIFVPGILIYAYNTYRTKCKNVIILIVSEVSLVICLLYFVLENDFSRNAIIDGHIFLLVENISKFVVPKFNIICSVAAIILFVCISVVLKKKANSSMIVCRLYFATVVILFVIQWIQLPYYSNIVAKGRIIQTEAIEMADYLNTNGIETVYYVQSKDANPYSENFHAYLKQDYIPCNDISLFESNNAGEKQAVIVAGSNIDTVIPLKKAKINTSMYELYTN